MHPKRQIHLILCFSFLFFWWLVFTMKTHLWENIQWQSGVIQSFPHLPLFLLFLKVNKSKTKQKPWKLFPLDLLENLLTDTEDSFHKCKLMQINKKSSIIKKSIIDHTYIFLISLRLWSCLYLWRMNCFRAAVVVTESTPITFNLWKMTSKTETLHEGWIALYSLLCPRTLCLMFMFSGICWTAFLFFFLFLAFFSGTDHINLFLLSMKCINFLAHVSEVIYVYTLDGFLSLMWKWHVHTHQSGQFMKSYEHFQSTFHLVTP